MKKYIIGNEIFQITATPKDEKRFKNNIKWARKRLDIFLNRIK